MKGILLSIDPGRVTGWAVIDIENEKAVVFGEVKITKTLYLSKLGDRFESGLPWELPYERWKITI